MLTLTTPRNSITCIVRTAESLLWIDSLYEICDAVLTSNKEVHDQFNHLMYTYANVGSKKFAVYIMGRIYQIIRTDESLAAAREHFTAIVVRQVADRIATDWITNKQGKTL